MCHKCSLTRFNIRAEAEGGAGKHEGEGILHLRLGGRIRSKEVSRGNQSPFSQGITGSHAKHSIHEFDVPYIFNILLHCESPLTPRSRLGEFNRDMGSEQSSYYTRISSSLPPAQDSAGTLRMGTNVCTYPLELWQSHSHTPTFNIKRWRDLCEPHQERKSSPQWIKRNNWWVQGQLSQSLLRVETITFGLSHPLFHPAIPGAQIQSTLCWAMATWITIISTTSDESGRAQHMVSKYC